jgi:hypothetical protein
MNTIRLLFAYSAILSSFIKKAVESSSFIKKIVYGTSKVVAL